MKKLFFLINIIIISAGCSHAQTSSIENIPPYHILNTDSVYVTPAALKKNKPVMIIYFSPDCNHCQRLMYDMKPKMKAFKKLQMVMITWVQYKAIKKFYRDFGLSAYPNITVGTEGYTYLVQKYYHVINTPYIAFYDGKGKLVKTFDKEPKLDELVKTAKKL